MACNKRDNRRKTCTELLQYLKRSRDQYKAERSCDRPLPSSRHLNYDFNRDIRDITPPIVDSSIDLIEAVPYTQVYSTRKFTNNKRSSVNKRSVKRNIIELTGTNDSLTPLASSKPSPLSVNKKSVKRNIIELTGANDSLTPLASSKPSPLLVNKKSVKRNITELTGTNDSLTRPLASSKPSPLSVNKKSVKRNITELTGTNDSLKTTLLASRKISKPSSVNKKSNEDSINIPLSTDVVSNKSIMSKKSTENINSSTKLTETHSTTDAVSKPTKSLNTSRATKQTAGKTKNIPKEMKEEYNSSFDLSTSICDGSFLSNLKRSSRGRLIKPVLTHMEGWSPDTSYSYDAYGEFQGISCIQSNRSKEIKIEQMQVKEETRCDSESILSFDNCPDTTLSCDLKPTIELEKVSTEDSRSTCKLIPCTQRRSMRLAMSNERTILKDNCSEEEVKMEKETNQTQETPPLRRSERIRNKGNMSEVENNPLGTHQSKMKTLANVNLEKINHKTKQQTTDQHNGNDVVTSNQLWDDDKLQKLKRVVFSIPSLTVNFWTAVSNAMGSEYTAEECQRVYFDHNCTSVSHATTSKHKQKPETHENKGVIDCKVGTLKRKRQLRTVLEGMDANYADDIFDSTPMQKRLKSVQMCLNIDCASDDQSESECSNIETYSITSPVSYKHSLGAPVRDNPPSFYSNMSQKRYNADVMVYRYQRNASKNKKHSKKVQFVPSTNCSSSQLVNKMHLPYMETGKSLQIFECSDNEDSYNSDFDE